MSEVQMTELRRANEANYAAVLALELTQAKGNYAVVKVWRDATRADYLAQYAKLPVLTDADYEDETRLDAHVQADMALAQATTYSAARDALAQAEQRLIDCGRVAIESMPQYSAHKETIDSIWPRTHLVNARRRLIEIIMEGELT